MSSDRPLDPIWRAYEIGRDCFKIAKRAVSRQNLEFLNKTDFASVSMMDGAEWIETSRHMLIRLFQLTTRCSVGSVSSVLSQDSSPVSDSVRRRRGLPRVPGRVPLVRGLQVPPMRARSRLRAAGTKMLAVRRLSSPSVLDITRRKPNPQHMVVC